MGQRAELTAFITPIVAEHWGERQRLNQRLTFVHDPYDLPVVEVANGIWRIELPTPWPVGPVHAYLIDDEPLTLFDSGPIYDPAFAALDAGLAACGRRVEDLDRIVVSHQHPDHWGAGQHLAQRANAELCALADFAVWLSDFPRSLTRDDRFADELMRAHGVVRSPSAPGPYRGDVAYCEPALVTRALRDGDVLQFAHRRFRVLHRPGHSRSDTVLYDDGCGVLLGADHVLSWPSVPLLSPPLDGAPSRARPRAFAEYKASLHATQTMNVETVLPGHGEVIRDPARVIDERLRLYGLRTEQILSVVDARPRTAIELATRTRGPVAEASAFFVLCDVLGFLDELIDAGALTETELDGIAHFALT